MNEPEDLRVFRHLNGFYATMSCTGREARLIRPSTATGRSLALPSRRHEAAGMLGPLAGLALPASSFAQAGSPEAACVEIMRSRRHAVTGGRTLSREDAIRTAADGIGRTAAPPRRLGGMESLPVTASASA